MTIRFSNILVVDDCQTSRTMLSLGLTAHGYNVQTAVDGVEALERIEQQLPDYILTDWQMPNMDGEQFCRRLRAADHDKYVYVIFYTGHPDSMSLVNGLGAGADSYVVKPIDLPELLAQLNSGARVLELDRRLTEKAGKDPLTGMMNRRYLVDTISRLLAVRPDRPESVACVMVDLDHFKSINDELGHLAGDSVIVQVSKVLTSGSRTSDFVCRYGGEEFAIIIPDCSESAAVLCAERCRKKIEETVQVAMDTGTRKVTASFGVYSSCGNDDAMQMIERADLALLKSKGLGRNRVVTYSSLTPNVAFDRTFDGSDLPVPAM